MYYIHVAVSFIIKSFFHSFIILRVLIGEKNVVL